MFTVLVKYNESYILVKICHYTIFLIIQNTTILNSIYYTTISSEIIWIVHAKLNEDHDIILMLCAFIKLRQVCYSI